jgi:hypothetical protein
MSRPAVVLAALILLAPAAPVAQAISSSERDQAVKYLTTMRDQVVRESETLTEAQWNFKSAPGRWSVGEVVEHLALAESFMFDMQQKTVAGPAASADQRAATKGKDDTIIKGVPDRTKKFQAPEPLQPGARLGSRAEILAAFKERRAKTIAYASTTKDDLRSRVSDSPLGPLDAYQWLLFAAAHSERHLAQLREVKADSNFPKAPR